MTVLWTTEVAVSYVSTKSMRLNVGVRKATNFPMTKKHVQVMPCISKFERYSVATESILKGRKLTLFFEMIKEVF